jgi:hypothetical protein
LNKPIVSVAIYRNGIIHSKPRPARHADVVEAMGERSEGGVLLAQGVQGFLDADGQFLNRQEGMERAKACNQLLVHSAYPSDLLYSEYLW